MCGVKAFPGSESGPSATWSTPRTCGPRTEGGAPAGCAKPAPGRVPLRPQAEPPQCLVPSPPLPAPQHGCTLMRRCPGGEPGNWLPWLQDAAVRSGPAALLGSWRNHSGDAPPRAQGWWVPTGWTPAPTEQTPSTPVSSGCSHLDTDAWPAQDSTASNVTSGPFCSLIFQILLPFECELLSLSCLL